MENKWKKPVIKKIAVKKITLSGSSGNNETKGNTSITKKDPNI